MPDSEDPTKKLKTETGRGGFDGRNRTAVGTEPHGGSSPKGPEFRTAVALAFDSLFVRFALQIALEADADVVADCRSDCLMELMHLKNLNVAVIELNASAERTLRRIDLWKESGTNPGVIVVGHKEVIAQHYLRLKRAQISMCLSTSSLELVRNLVTKVANQIANQRVSIIDPDIEKLMNQQPFSQCRKDRLELLKRLDFGREVLQAELELNESERWLQIDDLLKSLECTSDDEAKTLAEQNGVEQLPTKHCDSDDAIVDQRHTEIIAKWLQQRLSVNA